MRKLFVSALIVVFLPALMVVGVAGESGQTGVLWQNMPLIALLNGFYAGNISVAEALQHGSFGLGAFADLDGEMIADGGIIYRVRSDGTVDRPSPATALAFAAMTSFKAEKKLSLPPDTTLETLPGRLTGETEHGHSVYAVRLTGSFKALTARAPHRQEKPFVPFCEVAKAQATFPLTQLQGTITGYLVPAYLSSVESSGYHLHFISHDAKSGGHVLEFQTEAVTAEVQRIDRLEVDIPNVPLFDQVDLERVLTCPQ